MCSRRDRKRACGSPATGTTTLIVALTLVVRETCHVTDSNGHRWWACSWFRVLLADDRRNRDKQQQAYNCRYNSTHDSERVLTVDLLAKQTSDSEQDLLEERLTNIHDATDAEENALSR
jgi:hypothetical protein